MTDDGRPCHDPQDPLDGVRLGTAYYPEYQPYDRLEQDLDLMAAANITVIRVGESVWSTWEPADGRFELEWLAPVLDAAHERGIRAILGTPTYALPQWLWRAHPEIAARRADGSRVARGARQEIDHTNPVFRRYAERLVRRIVGRYATHPAVVGYQVDNEPGLHLLHNAAVFEGFVERLRARHGSVERLNRRWGLTYWSHLLSDWQDLWPPEGNTTPSYELAWRRYQAELTSEFIAWQASVVRELKGDHQFVTTCLAHDRPAVRDVEVAAPLDVSASNVYFLTQDHLALPDAGRGYEPGWYGRSVWQLFLAAERAHGARQAPFLVTETGAASIGGSHLNHPGYDGQLRQAALALVSRGARLVEYWHWHTLHYGFETYWGGILGHALAPGRVHAELRGVGEDLRRSGETLRGLRPDVEVLFLYSVESSWAMRDQPPLALPDGRADTSSYERVFAAFYRGFFDAGTQAGVVAPCQLGSDPAELARRCGVLVVPALYVADDATLAFLDGYAAAGGHLVLSFRSGYADEEACVRARVAPGPLRAAVGAHYLEYSNLSAPLPLRLPDDSPLALPVGARATGWADGLVPDDAQALAYYEHPHFGRWPAATTRHHHAGHVTYVGTLPDERFATALARFVVTTGDASRAGSARWVERPESVTVRSAVNAAGQRVWFVHNWSFTPVELPVPFPAVDAVAGGDLTAGQPVRLAAWDTRILTESRDPLS